MSCCGCLKYICSANDGDTHSWSREVSPLCCQACNGTVVPGGTVLGREVMEDKCGTVKTTVCKIKNRMVDNTTGGCHSVK